jgi:transposase
LNLKLLCPRPKPAKADDTKQREFKTTFDQTINTLTPQDHLLFFDAATVQHSATKTRVWGEKAHQPILPIIGGRKKMHLIGAIEPAGDKGWFADCPTLGARELIGFLKGILHQYPEGQIHMILDNARAHHAKRVTEFVTEQDRLHLLYLPPYSPDFNPIEDFWRMLRKDVTHNTYYPTFEEFRTAIVEYVTQFKYPTGKIASLAKKYKTKIENRTVEVTV